MPPEQAYDPNIQDPHRVAACAADAGRALVPAPQRHLPLDRRRPRASPRSRRRRPSGFGFAVAAHPRDPLTAWFVPAVKDECRVPVDGRLVGHPHPRRRRELRDARATACRRRRATTSSTATRWWSTRAATRLAMGSTTGNLWVSDSGGERWQQLAGHLPPIAQVAFAGGVARLRYRSQYRRPYYQRAFP